MKNKVFISGSISIKILPSSVEDSIDKIIQNGWEILVGDANGVDAFVQNYCLKCGYNNLTVYSISETPRYKASEEFRFKKVEVPKGVKGERERQKYKDEKMNGEGGYCLVVWDGKSKGSYSNIIRAIQTNKKVRIFLKDINNYLSQKKINKNEIEIIFRKNNGYTASEIIELLKADVTDYFKNTQELNQYLLKKGVLKRESKIYIPTPEFKNLFIETKYKGKLTGIKFKNEFIDWIVNKVKLHEIPERHKQMELSFN